MDGENYAQRMPVEDDVVLVKLGELQTEWDEQDDEHEDRKAEAAAAKKERDRIGDKQHKLLREWRNGEDIFLLNDGNLTHEKPDDATLFDNVEEPEPHGEAPDPDPEEPEVTDI